MPTGSKLRAPRQDPAFHICLVEPEIPPNTGSIARTCAATHSPLHLVKPLGFDISERAVRRAGLDYWHLLDLSVHDNFAAFEATQNRGSLHFFSANATRSYLDAPINAGDCLVFGKESSGLDPAILARYPDQVWGIPTSGAVRSLNLSNAVSIVLYDALRRAGSLSQCYVERDE